MTSTAPLDLSTDNDNDNDNDNAPCHLYCCDPQKALCGETLTGYDDVSLDEDIGLCAFCAVIDDYDPHCRCSNTY